MTICSIDNCDGAPVGRGLCEKHYRRLRKYGDPLSTKRAPPGTFTHCLVEGCNSQHLSMGYCNKHYGRWHKYGDPLICAFEKSENGAPLRWVLEVAMASSTDECLPYPFALAKGYGQIWVDGKKYGVNRYVCSLAHGEPPSDDHAAAHLCGNSVCANPRHLEWKTYAENEADKLIHGTHLRGARNPNAILSEDHALLIRNMVGTQTEIAAKFGISRRTVGAIKQRKIWKCLDDEPINILAGG